MKKQITPKVTQRELRQIARAFLAEFLKGNSGDTNMATYAINVLNTPDRKGE